MQRSQDAEVGAIGGVGGAGRLDRHRQPRKARVVHEAEKGAEPERAFRLEGMDDVYASPVSAAGRVYVTDRSGLTMVLRHVPAGKGQLEVLARNTLDDTFSASAALVGRELFLRGEKFLYCLSEPVPAKD